MSALGQNLPLLFVVAGWVIVNYQNNGRETRKEGRAMADLAKKQTMDIADKAVKYMTSDAPDLAYDIKSTLDALEIELDRFPNFSNQSPLMFRFNRFADAVTGDDFESSTRPKRTRHDKDVLTVSRTRNELLTEIERQFRAYYR